MQQPRRWPRFMASPWATMGSAAGRAEIPANRRDLQRWSRAAAFVPGARGKWMADLFRLARLRLARAGVSSVHGGGVCTHADRARFYSYRRDGVTGRFASLIWLAA